MKTINLRDFYYWYDHDEFVEVSDEVAAELCKDKRTEKIHDQRMRRNKSFYSLDRDDSIETSAICYYNDSPERIYGKMERHCDLCRALNSLPELQGRRVEAHYLLGMSTGEIAAAEGVNERNVRHSISKGLANMRKYLKNNFAGGYPICPQSEAGI